jgi:TolB protein
MRAPLDVVWSPDGAKIAYGYSNGSSWTLKVINADGSGGTSLGSGLWPAWSPDGSRLAYNITGNPARIGLINADGTGATVLTDGYQPTWSPDGTKIAFWGGSPSTEIWVINP